MMDSDSKTVTSHNDVAVGDIVYQDMDANDGMTLKGDYISRKKYFVIVGKNSKGDAIGLCLVNSNLDFYKDNPLMQKFQYTLLKKNYPTILAKDSRLDCALLFPMKVRKSVAVKARIVGHLTETDEKAVIHLVSSCEFIDEHVRKVYRIGMK
ncbi:MAG: hypothetical protein K5890_05030 [Bacteroidales bacterium]|nr:hypothetical protein [Bacteroidales bacterium]